MKNKALSKRKLSSQQQRSEKKKNELIAVREEGIKFPDYNPLPERKENLTKKQKKVAGLLKYKEKMRNTTPSKPFVGWEYKDRYSYRKQT